MKVDFNPSVVKPVATFPYLGKYNHSNFYVLFTADSTGIVVIDNDPPSEDKYEVGHHFDRWDEGLFTRVPGTLTLTFEG